MGTVYTRAGAVAGTVDYWHGIFDAQGQKVGRVNPLNNQVLDNAGQLVGYTYSSGLVCDAAKNKLCQVGPGFMGIINNQGKVLGRADSAGAPEPGPDVQWRGAAALLLLCPEVVPAAKAKDLPVQRPAGEKFTNADRLPLIVALVIFVVLGVLATLWLGPVGLIIPLPLVGFFLWELLRPRR